MDLTKLQEIPPWEWPDDADQMLLKILKTGPVDAPDRQLAVELASDQSVMNDALAKALLSVAGNDQEKDEVRGMAAISLGPVLEHADVMGFEDEDDVVISEKVFNELQQGLQKLYMRAELPKKVRRRILEGSVRAPLSWHREAVHAACDSGDDEWRLTAVFCMQYVAGFETQILEALQDPDELIHYHAVVAAGNWELEEAWDPIVKLVQSGDTEKNLRIAAIEAVATINPEAAPDILGPLLESEDEDIVDATHEALILAEGLVEFGDDEYEYDEDDDEDDEEIF